VLVGTARRVRDPEEAQRALECVVDHVIPGRSSEARPPSDAELRQTLVLEVPIAEASAKVRAGGPVEEPDDLANGSWGGVLPITTTYGPPQHDGQDTRPPLPESLASYSRP